MAQGPDSPGARDQQRRLEDRGDGEPSHRPHRSGGALPAVLPGEQAPFSGRIRHDTLGGGASEDEPPEGIEANHDLSDDKCRQSATRHRFLSPENILDGTDAK